VCLHPSAQHTWPQLCACLFVYLLSFLHLPSCPVSSVGPEVRESSLHTFISSCLYFDRGWCKRIHVDNFHQVHTQGLESVRWIMSASHWSKAPSISMTRCHVPGWSPHVDPGTSGLHLWLCGQKASLHSPTLEGTPHCVLARALCLTNPCLPSWWAELK
jgi:hypothetical protein